MTKEEIEADLEAAAVDQNRLAELAQRHTGLAMDTLVKAMRSRGDGAAPWPSKITAAKAVLDYGHGRAGLQANPGGVVAPAGLTIVINHLTSPGESSERVVDVQAEVAELAGNAGELPEPDAEPAPGE